MQLKLERSAYPPPRRWVLRWLSVRWAWLKPGQLNLHPLFGPREEPVLPTKASQFSCTDGASRHYCGPESETRPRTKLGMWALKRSGGLFQLRTHNFDRWIRLAIVRSRSQSWITKIGVSIPRIRVQRQKLEEVQARILFPYLTGLYRPIQVSWLIDLALVFALWARSPISSWYVSIWCLL
jgi:hypothetical protein